VVRSDEKEAESNSLSFALTANGVSPATAGDSTDGHVSEVSRIVPNGGSTNQKGDASTADTQEQVVPGVDVFHAVDQPAVAADAAAVVNAVEDENSNISEPEPVVPLDLGAEPSYQEVNETTPPEDRLPPAASLAEDCKRFVEARPASKVAIPVPTNRRVNYYGDMAFLRQETAYSSSLNTKSDVIRDKANVRTSIVVPDPFRTVSFIRSRS
jgi:hypothetical protein